jgi:MFS family permease
VYRPDSAVDLPWTSRRFWAGFGRLVPLNVWMLGLTSLLTDVSSEMVVSVLPAYFVLSLQLSPLTYGALDGLYAGATAATRWVSGVVADRGGRYKEAAVVGYGLSALCRIGLPVVGSAPTALAVIITVDRFGKGIRTAPRDALISLSAPQGALAHAFGVHRALDATGAFLGPLLAVWILTQLPGAYDVVFVTSFAVAIVGLGVLVTFVRNVPRAATPTAATPALRQALAVVGLPDVRRILIAAGLLGLVTASDGLIYIALQRVLQLPAHALPLLYVGTSAFFLVLSVPIGMVADRIGRTRVFIAGHVALLLVYGLVLTPMDATLTPLFVVAMLGAYYAATDGVLMALASPALPVDRRGGGLAIVATVTNLGRAAAAVLFGLVWTMWSREVAVGAFALALATSVTLASLLLRRRPGGEA